MAQRFGLIAGGAASAVVVAWLAFSGGPAKTVRAEVDPTAAGSIAAGSARADLAEGKRLYLTREYAKSAAVLGRAMAHPEELSALERQDLESYLRRAREAVARASSQQSGITTAAYERPFGVPEARVAQADATSDRFVGDAAPSRMQLASFEQPAAQPMMSGGTPKEQAASLMAQARALAKAGRFDEARAIALKATELPVSWSLFDERPQHLIAEIDRSARTRTILPEYPVASTRTPAASTIRGQSPVDAGTDQAQSLLREARSALKAGDLAAAEAKVAEAETLDIVYGVFDDRPELIRKDLDQIYAGNARPTQNIAAAPAGGAPSETKQRATD
ncbi:MAG: hypothetical protein M3552_20690, partial [Planctomycetota bacterium]|nr:hypothetical protein [Planctomycetota bacterium]